jgi:hypothetical protein
MHNSRRRGLECCVFLCRSPGHQCDCFRRFGDPTGALQVAQTLTVAGNAHMTRCFGRMAATLHACVQSAQRCELWWTDPPRSSRPDRRRHRSAPASHAASRPAAPCARHLRPVVRRMLQRTQVRHWMCRSSGPAYPFCDLNGRRSHARRHEEAQSGLNPAVAPAIDCAGALPTQRAGKRASGAPAWARSRRCNYRSDGGNRAL